MSRTQYNRPSQQQLGFLFCYATSTVMVEWELGNTLWTICHVFFCFFFS